MEVWLLWGLEPITANGEARARAVTIGKHGVQIARGMARGLLLPGVAVEHHLDARAFLQQVCLKAGLPTDAWLDGVRRRVGRSVTIEVSANHAPITGGVIVRSADGRLLYDNSFAARLARLKPELRRRVAARLFPAGAARGALDTEREE